MNQVPQSDICNKNVFEGSISELYTKLSPDDNQ